MFLESQTSRKRVLEIAMAVILLISMLIISNSAAKTANSSHVETTESNGRTVIIDAGHGGDDPGKVGVNKILEKDINLKIALQLKKFLEANDVTVVLTREGDAGLYEAGSNNKKVQDMKNRCEIIRKTNPAFTVSIHQNSYHEEYVKGAQVFYYTQSEDSKLLAETLQRQIVKTVDPDNKRVAKANDTYYLLKKTATPIVIVECGFLSNWEEAERLCTEAYQEKIAWSIHLGILQHLNQAGD